MADPKTTKKDLDDFMWLAEHPEYEHRVVGIREFIDSPEYLNAKDECWPNIKDDLEDLDNSKCTEAVLCYAIGGGKSFASSIITTYNAYNVLCLKNPQKFLGIAKDSLICFINVSIRAEQSKKVVFTEIKARIDNSPWFQKHCPPDPDIRSELRFPKSVSIFPGNSNERFPLGFNIMGGVMDEAAFYTETDARDVAEEMFNALHSRIKNRFGDKGLLVMISSPRYVDDFIEKKMKEAQTNPNIFSRRKSLWQSKPLSKFSDNWIDFDGNRIPAEFETEARRNPEVFKRDYLAQPSLALEPYFKRMDLVEVSIDPSMKHSVDEYGKFIPSFKGKYGKQYFVHIDLSHKRDATGFCMLHMEDDVIIVDLMMQIKAPPGGEINFSDIRAKIIELKDRGFDIAGVTFDGWNSIDMIQILNEKGFNCEVLSVDRDTAAYDTLKDKIYTGKFKCYRYEPFLIEASRLELKDGKKVDHPPTHGGSKDVSDSVAGATFNAITHKNNFMCWVGGKDKGKTQEEIMKEQATYEATGLVPYGYFRGRR